MMTVIILSVMNNGSPVRLGGRALIAFQVLVGAALGVGIGLAALWAMRRFSFSTDGFDAILFLRWRCWPMPLRRPWAATAI